MKPYPPAFFEIQVAFARKMAELAGTPFYDSVLRKTALYRILGLDWSLDSQHPVWQRFIAELGDNGAGFGETYRFYMERYTQGLVPDHDTSRPHWGCFSYQYTPDTRIVRLTL